jgi:hypothetical protein
MGSYNMKLAFEGEKLLYVASFHCHCHCRLKTPLTSLARSIGRGKDNDQDVHSIYC